MKQDKAIELVEKTFKHTFDKDHYVLFLKNLFHDKIEPRNKVYTGTYIKEAYRPYIRKYEQVGKFIDSEGNTIDLLAVELIRGKSVERARSSQRNFIAEYLKKKNHREGALVAFYSVDSDDWRFSLIKMEYSLEEKKDKLTPAKRFSFLVGRNENCHTAQKQFMKLLTREVVPSLAEVEAAFNIETVTKEFFEKYKYLFLNLKEHIEKEITRSKQLKTELLSRDIDAVSFTKKLLGQIVFLYFIQKKGWLGVPKNENWGKGDKQFLHNLLNQAIDKGKYFFSDYLVYLFYEALATEHRGGSDSSYYKKLDCRIPFLNGGLFEADYNWENIKVDIPNEFFANENRTKEGDTGDGIIDVFNRYNFTVKEDEPLDKEVAVDPEMLGKVFENLLEVKDRKSKGAFYTPREIVHYMCQESLIAYLDTAINGEASAYQKIGEEQIELFGNEGKKGQLEMVAEVDTAIKVPKQDIEKFIREGIAAIDNDTHIEIRGEETKTYSYLIPESIRNNAETLDKALANIRICDPAIGSGAFPVGIMNEIVKAREVLSCKLKGAERTPYEFKHHAIQECIYGVDIEHSAIDIAKLRLWLSLVVDEDDFYKIKPLPNLDYKIVCANSLINLPDNIVKNDAAEKEMEKLKEKFFSEYELDKKKELRKKINQSIQKLLATSNEFLSYKVEFDFKLFFSEVFHEKNGFDIFIGNPPYVGQKGHKELFQEIKNSPLGEKYHQRRMDLFYFFFHCGLLQLKQGGVLSFITTNYYPTATYSDKLRKHIFDDASIVSLINFNEFKVFESATGQHNLITILRKGKNGNLIANTAITQRIGDANNTILNDILLGNDVETKYYLQTQESIFEKDTLYIRIEPNSGSNPNGINAILNKLKANNKALSEYCFIEQGIVSGSDKVSESMIKEYPNLEITKGEGIYILTNDEIDSKNLSEADMKYFKKTYKNSDVRKWIFSPNDFLNVLYIKSTGKYFELPKGVKKHLDRFKLILINRNVRVGTISETDYQKFIDGKKEISYIMNASSMKNGNFYCLSYPRRGKDTFEIPKIVNSRRANSNVFALEDKGYYEQSDLVISTLKNVYKNKLSLLYILGILNSKLLYQWFYHKGKRKGETLELFQKPISEVPLKFVEVDLQTPIVKLVEKIITEKKKSPKSNTSSLEHGIDLFVYHLYNLTYEEAKIIDPEVSEEEFGKCNEA
jgi:TaqI-like C-terminal specificity domain/Eco57I restriction-modification methylase